jgi:methionyl aminopeptidase
VITIKTQDDIAKLREGGKRLAFILNEVAKAIKPGVSTKSLDDLALKLSTDKGDTPAFLNYKPYGADRPYPASLCISINDEVVHGIPNEERILKEGEIVSLDMGLTHDGLITDSAITVPVGEVDKNAIDLMDTTKKALYAGIKKVREGQRLGDVGFAIESFANEKGYGVVRELCGHGVGYKVHEDPYVPNYGEKGKGIKLKAGMVIAIEPMFNEGTECIELDRDGYTYKTKDCSRSAHFEHTVVVTEKGAEILTI